MSRLLGDTSLGARNRLREQPSRVLPQGVRHSEWAEKVRMQHSERRSAMSGAPKQLQDQPTAPSPTQWCKTGYGWAECSIHVTWINLKERTDKARHMRTMLNATFAQDRQGNVRSCRRLEGVRVSCMPHDKHGLHLPCNMSRTPHGLTPVGIWMGETATDIWRANHGIEKRVFNHIARQGVIGVWSAHIDALIKFLHHDRGKPNKENFMLVCSFPSRPVSPYAPSLHPMHSLSLITTSPSP